MYDKVKRLRKPIKIGGTNEIDFTITNPKTGGPMDLTGWTNVVHLRWKDAPNTHLLSKGGTISGNIVTLTLQPADFPATSGREGMVEVHLILTDPSLRPSHEEFEVWAQQVYNPA